MQAYHARSFVTAVTAVIRSLRQAKAVTSPEKRIPIAANDFK